MSKKKISFKNTNKKIKKNRSSVIKTKGKKPIVQNKRSSDPNSPFAVLEKLL